jgi:hypothetical protein
MGDPNDIKGRLQFEQSKKGLNPEKAEKDAKAAAAAAKVAKAKAAAALAAKSKKKPTPTKPPGVNSFGRTYDEEVQYQRYQKSLNIGKTPPKPTKPAKPKYQIPASPTH